MNKVSRRSLAHWAATRLAAGTNAGTVAKHLAAVIIQQGMTEQLQFLLSDINWELEQNRSLAVGRVTSAHPLTMPLESVLVSQIKKITGAKNVTLEKKIDKSVLGGIRVETANHVWDYSVSRKLSELREVS
jgi:F-type H+-transporting ATPase subunit delta